MEMPVQEGGDSGSPIVISRNSSVSAKAFSALAERVQQQVATPA
jgi:ATP-binding protein involved in chromosome partitioning